MEATVSEEPREDSDTMCAEDVFRDNYGTVVILRPGVEKALQKQIDAKRTLKMTMGQARDYTNSRLTPSAT